VSKNWQNYAKVNCKAPSKFDRIDKFKIYSYNELGGFEGWFEWDEFKEDLFKFFCHHKM